MNIQSVKARLKNHSRKQKAFHQHILIRFFQERFLYRLSISQHREEFLLKGGALVYVHRVAMSRFTQDVDLLLVNRPAAQDELFKVFKTIAEIEHDDGVIFATEGMTATTINADNKYQGTRIRVKAYLGNINEWLQVDIGIGDRVTPGPVEITYPTLLPDFTAPKLRAYALETLVAEKFHAMVHHGRNNSRMKDFYDIHKFAGQVDKTILSNAIQNTFAQRKTAFKQNPVVFEQSFYTDENRLVQWKSFLKNNHLEDLPFLDVFEVVQKYIQPLYPQ